MIDQDIADLRQSLQNTTSVLASLLAILIKDGPLREPEQQEMLRALHSQAVDACDCVRECRLKLAFE
jgi:hypothetical protein